MSDEPIEVAEPEGASDPGLWRYVRMEHSIPGKVYARECLEALPTARVEQTPDGYRVWAASCDKPRL